MATVLEYAKRDVKPLAIEPYDREWGVGVSGLSDEKSPFPRINRLHAWVRNKRHSVDPKRGQIVTEAFKKYENDSQRCAASVRHFYVRRRAYRR